MAKESIVHHIRNYGGYRDAGEGRRAVLRDLGFPLDRVAEHVILTGCLQPELMPHVFRALGELLDRLRVDYTFLSKEYCCGWMPLGQPAAMAKDEQAVEEFKQVAQEFVGHNLQQVAALGARSAALFCTACEPQYSNWCGETGIELISYVDLLDRYFEFGRLDLKADYYAGCYRFRRRIAEKPLDVNRAATLLNKVQGLSLNHLDTKLCCHISPHAEQLTQSLTSQTVVTICTGCYHRLREVLSRRPCQVLMLPEVLLSASCA
jgi:hypothetical protein